MTALHLSLFGTFDCRDASGAPIALPTRKARAILAYLAMNPGKQQPREKLAALVWDDKTEEQARANLRKALSRMRRALPDEAAGCLDIGARHACLRPEAVEIDVARFEELATAGTPEALEEAAGIYRAELLEGFADCGEGFDDWLAAERRRLEECALGVLERLLDHYIVTGAIERAIQIALRLLAMDPLQENVQRALIRLYLFQGRIGAAHRQYETCRELLARELGVEPAPETETLHAEVLRKLPADAPATATTDSRSPGKPWVAVLPFASMSGDPGQEHFADGITQDVVTELSRFRSLMVIAADSSFHYKGRSPAVRDVGAELSVQYVVEGSVRRAGKRLRITARLVDAVTGARLWAEKYDHDVAEIFSVEDEVVGRIVSTLTGRIEDNDRWRIGRRRPEDLAAYDCVLLGGQHLRQGSIEDLHEARRMFERAIEMEPGNARAYADLARSYLDEVWDVWTTDLEGAGENALAAAKKAVALDEHDCHAHTMLATAHLYAKAEFRQAGIHFDRALELNPNEYDAYCLKSWLLALTGEAEQAIALADHAIRLSPHTPEDCFVAQSMAAYTERRYEESLAMLDSVPNPANGEKALRAAVCAQLGRSAEAGRAMADFLAAAGDELGDYPGEDGERWRRYWTRRYPFKHEADLEHLLEGLEKAGLPMAHRSTERGIAAAASD